MLRMKIYYMQENEHSHKDQSREPVADLIFYEISREEIEAGNTSRFLRDFRPPDNVSPADLKALMGKILFNISGYDNDESEVYTVPAVRAFFQALHHEWPCWLFFCDLESPGFAAIGYCILPTLRVRKVSGAPTVAVFVDRGELSVFLKECIDLLEHLSELAELSEVEVEQRTEKMIEYINRWFSRH